MRKSAFRNLYFFAKTLVIVSLYALIFIVFGEYSHAQAQQICSKISRLTTKQVPNYTDSLETADWLSDKELPERWGFFPRVVNKSSCDETPYQTIFFEDFLTNSLNADQWLTSFPYPGFNDTLGHQGSHCAFLPENVSIADGMLTLSIKKMDTPLFFPTNSNQHQRDHSGAVIFSNSGSKGPLFQSGCFRYGKYTIRAKTAPAEGAFTSFWFVGWAGEVDVFEFFDTPAGELLASLHQWSLTESKRRGNTHYSYDKDIDLGDLSADFHTYSLEWTPYKFVWAVDGNPVYYFFRYYTKNIEGNRVCYHSVDCQDIPDNTAVQLFEQVAWNRFQVFLLDLLIHVDNNPTHGAVNRSSTLVDWIKIEQKTDVQLELPEVLCADGGLAVLVNAPAGAAPIWNCSEGIICQPDSSQQLRLDLSFSGAGKPGWVEANIPDAGSCFGHTFKKNMWLGDAAVPIVQPVINPCNDSITLIISNPSPFTNYSWQIEGAPQVFAGNNGQYIDIAITPQAFYKTINYVLTYNNPCGVNRKYGWVQIPPCNNRGHLLVSPDPAAGIINVQLEGISPNYSGAPMVVIDTYFNPVKTVNAVFPTTSIDVSDLQNGYYFAYLILNEEQRIYSSKFLVQK